jgi:hypothetical protein
MMSDAEDERAAKRARVDMNESGEQVPASATPDAAAESKQPSTSAAVENGDGVSEKIDIERKMLREEDVGITEYIDASIPPFQAVIKQRCLHYFFNFAYSRGKHFN